MRVNIRPELIFSFGVELHSFVLSERIIQARKESNPQNWKKKKFCFTKALFS